MLLECKAAVDIKHKPQSGSISDSVSGTAPVYNRLYSLSTHIDCKQVVEQAN